MPFTILTGDTFLSDGTAKKINLPSSADYFRTWNVTQIAQTNPNKVVMAEWFGPKFGAGASPYNDGLRWVKTNTLLQIDVFSNSTASDGFIYVTSVPVIEAQSANPITLITQAAGAVVSQTNTYSEGDILQFYGTTGMPQISGMTFEISSVSGSGYTLIGLDSSGFSATATAGFTRRISKALAVEPQFLYITGISKAIQAVVTTSVDPTAYYFVGMKVHFSIPSSFGMTEMDQLTGTILSLDATTYEMVVDINSSAFDAFAFPVPVNSTQTGAVLFATLAPAGAATKRDPNTYVETGYNFQYQSFRTGQFVPYLLLGGGAQSPAGAAGDQINWMEYKLEN